jgi:hypothetical protein
MSGPQMPTGPAAATATSTSTSAPAPSAPAVRFELDAAGTIGTITLDRPGNRNSMTAELLDAFVVALAAARAASELRVLVITGTSTSSTARNGSYIAKLRSWGASGRPPPARCSIALKIATTTGASSLTLASNASASTGCAPHR